MKHSHAKLIHLWADGQPGASRIERLCSREKKWVVDVCPVWNCETHRIALPDGTYIYNDCDEPKPEKKKVVRWQWVIQPSSTEPFYLTSCFYLKAP